MLIYGINPVLEALKARRVTRLRVSARSDKRIDEILALAAKQGIPVDRVDASLLDRSARGGVHQGIVAEVADTRDFTVADLAHTAATSGDSRSGAAATSGDSRTGAAATSGDSRTGAAATLGDSRSERQPPLIVVLDGIEDPHNVGAILRTCDAAGATGVIRQDRHSASLDGVVAKASAGAVSHVRIATVVNIARAIEELKEAGVWTIGLAGEAGEDYTDVDWTLPSAIVLGAEGTGLRRLVRERCDRLVCLPMRGAVDSLNVSVAAGVVLYEAVRQRADGHRGTGKD